MYSVHTLLHTGYGALYVLYFLAVASWVTWFFFYLRKKELLAKLSEFTKWQLFLFKKATKDHFEWKYVVVILFSFFVSLRKITWFNFKQPEIRGHVEYGHTGCGVFKQGLQNFCIRINTPKGNYWMLSFGLMASCQK